MKNTHFKKIVLAYSGGLDTSVIIPWLKEHYSAEVIAVAGDVGQLTEEMREYLRDKALKTGASKIYIEDLTKEFVEDYAFEALRADAVYEKKYLLGTATSRPLIGKRIAEIALAEGADAICHGCTGKGNDQIRFEMAFTNFAPDLPVIAPWRFWELDTREKEIEYAEKHNVPLEITRETNYSKDANIWHLSHEGLDLEDPANEPDFERILEKGVSPESAPDEPEYITVRFKEGTPVAVNDMEMEPVELLTYLNEVGGKHGVGIDDVVENRLVGMKSHGVYENAGGAILYHAHWVLETVVLDKDTLHEQEQVGIKMANLIYDGKWFTPLREALSAFAQSTQKYVTGEVRMKLYKGNIIQVGVTSPNSLYDENIASFDNPDVYQHKDSGGFSKIYTLPTRIRARMEERNGLR